MTKLTLIPAKESIEANITNGATLYYDSDDTQVVTVNVTIPTGVTTLNIAASDFSPVSADGGYTVNGDATNGYCVSLAAEGEKQINFTFTLDESKYSEQTGKTSTTITFSDASGNATEDAVNVNLVETPEVTFTPDETSKIMNINDTYTVTMDPNGGTLTSLSIAAEGFTVVSSSDGLTGPTNNVYTYAGGYTQFTFTPTSAGSSTIRFYDGQGENINVPEKNIIVTVNAAITATATPSTIYYDGDNKDVTVSVTIPKGVSGLNISATNFSYGDDTDGVYTYDRTDGATTETTVQLVFTLKDGVTEDSSITFSDANSNANVTGATVDINVEAKPVQGEEVVIWGNGEGEGNTVINWSPGFVLDANRLAGYAGQTLKMVVQTDDSTEYKQIQVKIRTDEYNSQDYQLFAGHETLPQNQLVELEVAIPNELQYGLVFTGSGVTFKKFYIPASTP